jgi:hypothetical protein
MITLTECYLVYNNISIGYPIGVKTGGYGRIVAHLVSYPNVFKMDSGSDTDS